MTAINAVNQMGYTMGDRWKASKEDEQLIISLSSTHSEKVLWVTVLVEATVILLVNMKAYLGTAPAAFTTLPDLEVNPLVASILQLTPQELLGLLPDGGSHSHCTETECIAFASMRTRLGPVDNNNNLSALSEITEMAGQVAIEEKAVKVVTKEVERVDEYQQVDTEVEEPAEDE